MAILAPYGFTETHSDDWVNHSLQRSICHVCITQFTFAGLAVDNDSSVGLLSHSCHPRPSPTMADPQSLPSPHQ